MRSSVHLFKVRLDPSTALNPIGVVSGRWWLYSHVKFGNYGSMGGSKFLSAVTSSRTDAADF